MNQIATTGIVLARLNYGEAGKIITIVTPSNGKIRVMARGVRKIKSKLAGGIELFSVSNITYIPGKKDIGTLVSTRLQTHFSRIVEDINRTMIGYDMLKLLNRATEDECDVEYYQLILHSLATLNDLTVDPRLTKCWFMAQLLRILGHTPNMSKNTQGTSLDGGKQYGFDYEQMGFYEQKNGSYSPNHIKMLRLLMTEEPGKLQVIKNNEDVLVSLEQLLDYSLKQFVRG